MSDEDDHTSTEEDFSASEDEWKPGKSARRQQSDSESDDDDSDFEEGATKRRDAKSRSGQGAIQTKKRKSTGTSLRTKLFNKYKPPPKTVRNQSTSSNRRTAQVANNVSRPGKKPDCSDSDSSGDDYLVNPDELDLKSSFFDVKPSTSNETNAAGPPNFDCNAGMKLSDSEEDIDDDDDDETESSKDITITNSIKATDKPVDLGYLQNFAENIEKAKTQYKKHKDRSLLEKKETKIDVSSLLQMGEGTSSTSTISTKKKRHTKKIQSNKEPAADTDSDLEEVEGDDDRLPESLANGIQVSIDLPQRQRKDKKAIDVEATLKRQLNRAMKENQILLHKVSLLGHIYNGLYLNKVANNIKLMPIALKILPSQNVYPNGKTEIKYFQSMVTWFKTAIKIQDNRMFPKLKNLNPITSLAVQMKHRHAICKRDFILMFVILLRAMGMQCRLVINLNPMPLRPPQSALCSLKAKPSTENDKDKKGVKKNISPKKDKKTEKEQLKVATLTNDERLKLKNKVESLQKEIESKKKGQLEPKPSFEEVLEAKAAEKIRRPVRSTATKSKAPSEDLKRKSQDKPLEPEKKKKVEENSSKSSYFPEDKKKSTKKNEKSSLETSHETNSPSISINSKGTAKQTEKMSKTSTTRSTRSRTETVTRKNIIPEVVIVANEKQNLENITNTLKTNNRETRGVKSRSKSPKTYISTDFIQTKASRALQDEVKTIEAKRSRSKSPNPTSDSIKAHISTQFLKSKSNRQPTVEVIPGKPSPRKLRSKTKLAIPQLDGADDIPKPPSRRKKPYKKLEPNSDEDFQDPPMKKPKAIEKLKRLDRRVLSSDVPEDEDVSPGKAKKDAVNMWVEVYCELEDQWVCINLFKGKVNCVDSIRKSVTPSTLAYVFAFNNDATMKDVTPRYCTQWALTVRKHRVEQQWLDEAIEKYVTKSRLNRDLTEDMDLRKIHLDKPMPTTISEYKDHPLYALERHLLKFQAIYPPNAITLGFVRGEPVYPRECVHTLHSREIWLKSARVVKLGEKPYKIVKARPKWDRLTSSVIKDQPLEIFGYWQTQEYEPPTAENGIVPRNAYGNVELFKECMLPKKTVHLHLPGLNRVCKKLGIDCVPAVIGFDFHQGSCHPLYDGFVVCEEFAQTAVDAWEKDQLDAERKEQEKYEARVYGNWKKLIKGLLIRERLKLKYNF